MFVNRGAGGACPTTTPGGLGYLHGREVSPWGINGWNWKARSRTSWKDGFFQHTDRDEGRVVGIVFLQKLVLPCEGRYSEELSSSFSSEIMRWFFQRTRGNEVFWTLLYIVIAATWLWCQVYGNPSQSGIQWVNLQLLWVCSTCHITWGFVFTSGCDWHNVRNKQNRKKSTIIPKENNSRGLSAWIHFSCYYFFFFDNRNCVPYGTWYQEGLVQGLGSLVLWLKKTLALFFNRSKYQLSKLQSRSVQIWPATIPSGLLSQKLVFPTSVLQVCLDPIWRHFSSMDWQYHF